MASERPEPSLESAPRRRTFRIRLSPAPGKLLMVASTSGAIPKAFVLAGGVISSAPPGLRLEQYQESFQSLSVLAPEVYSPLHRWQGLLPNGIIDIIALILLAIGDIAKGQG